MADHLPDPLWTALPQRCLSCNYLLTGLSSPGRCPECGFQWGEQTLILNGVANSSTGTPLWRKVSMAVSGLCAVGMSMFWPVLFFLPPMVGTFLVVVCIGVLIYLIASGKRQRRGVEQFIFVDKQFAQCAVADCDEADNLLYDWQQINRVELKRISPVWYRLRLGWIHESHRYMSRVVLSIGFRCPDELAESVKDYLQNCINQHGSGLIEPSQQDITTD